MRRSSRLLIDRWSSRSKPIRDGVDNLRLNYIDKSHLIGDQRYSDGLTYDGMWENDLFNYVTMVLPKLTMELLRPFKMEGKVRDDDSPQYKAVREAMTNCIIHADLMLNGVLKRNTTTSLCSRIQVF